MEGCEKQQECYRTESSVKKQFMAAIVSSLLTFMYGNSIGWSSSAVRDIESGILSNGSITTESSGWIGGAYCLGALVTSPFYGLLADARGRKFAGYVVAMIFAINWSIILVTDSFTWVLVARSCAGAAASGSITVASIYNNEISELKIKSAIGGILAVIYVSGIESAYILASFVAYKTLSVIYLSICSVWFFVWWLMPETPAHLALHGNEKEAIVAISWLREINADDAKRVLQEIREEQVGAADSATIREFFLDPAARKAILLVSLLITFQTFCGAFALNNYAGTIFSKAGGSITPQTGAIIFGGAMIFGALLPPILADRAPRKVLLCFSTCFMGIGLACFGTIQLWKSWMTPEEVDSYKSVLPPIVLSFSICAYFSGLGSIPYISATELFSDENRGVAGACVSLVTWLTSFILLQFYGISVEAFGDYTVFYFFTAVVFSCCLFVVIFLPESRGKSFPDIRKILVPKSS